jgi:hypothetical protein
MPIMWSYVEGGFSFQGPGAHTKFYKNAIEFNIQFFCFEQIPPPYSATVRAFGANAGATTSQWGAAAVRPLLGV